MTYEEFKKDYESKLTTCLKYSPKEVGSKIYCEKLADLADAYPDFMDKLDYEHELEYIAIMKGA